MLARPSLSTILVALGLAAACRGPEPLPPENPKTTYPTAPVAPVIFETLESSSPAIETRRGETVDILHGTKIADPYRWLEKDSKEVEAWIAEQNALLDSTLEKLPDRDAIHHRLTELLSIGDVSHPSVKRVARNRYRYFYSRRKAGQDQPVLYVRDGLEAPDRTLIDPNSMSQDNTTSLDWYFPSNDGALLAYGISEGGSELSTLFIRDVSTGKDLSDRITRTRYSSICWLPGNKRFYYARYPAPGSVPRGEETYHRRIYEHVIGRSPEQDPLIFEAREMTDFPSCSISPDGRWLVVRVHQGWSKNEVYIADTRAKKLEFVKVAGGKNQLYYTVIRNDRLYIHTNDGAPRYALYSTDPSTPQREHWRPLIAEKEHDVLSDVHVVGGQILATYMRDAASRLERFHLDGKSIGEVELPTVGTSDGFSGLPDGDEAFFNFESFAQPDGIRRIDLKTGDVTEWASVDSNLDSGAFAVTSGKARSKDGTLVPYYAVHKKGVPLAGGNHATLLYGYGGFNVNLQPRFTRSVYAFLERGGVYVQANLRGGGEFGEDWHRSGQLDKKQNVFDDFIAVAEHLIAQRVTTQSRLGIFGRSNGGLLVAAAVTQRPDLFRAAISGVPLTDMIRYHRFLIAKLWIPEYGSSEDPEQFKWLYAYSPYHRVRAGTKYPAVLFTTAASDTRVHPMHARKMAAALQWATSSKRPVFLRSETKAGHGAGKPVTKTAEEFADIYSFLMWQLGLLEVEE